MSDGARKPSVRLPEERNGSGSHTRIRVRFKSLAIVLESMIAGIVMRERCGVVGAPES